MIANGTDIHLCSGVVIINKYRQSSPSTIRKNIMPYIGHHHKKFEAIYISIHNETIDEIKVWQTWTNDNPLTMLFV